MRQCLYGFPDAAKFWQQVNCAEKNLLNISVPPGGIKADFRLNDYYYSVAKSDT